MMKNPDEVAAELLGVPYETLNEHAKHVTRHIAERKYIVRNPEEQAVEAQTFGQRAADAVARFGGSWAFIGIFSAVMILWIFLNSFILLHDGHVFDPYPYILLNLFLSMLAAMQAPVILMSQNRQAEKDRMNAGHDYEVNLKAELEIMLLHEKVDLLREGQWSDLLGIQKEQLRLLALLIEGKPVPQ